jgi:hypothetical protein
VVPVEFITPSLYIAQATHMTKEESVAQRPTELKELEETRFLVDFHQLGMIGTLIPRYSHKETRYYSTIVSTRSILASCACTSWDHS